METTPHILVLLALIVIMFSCSKPQPEASSLLERAEQLVENYPDSALVLIDSIYYPERTFGKENFMRYNLVRVQVRHKNFLPIAEDTVIFEVKNYFIKHSRNLEKTALACYYCGWLHRERGDLNLAMLEYNEAKSHAENSDNISFIALIQFNIGALFREHGLYAEALKSYKLSKQMYRKTSTAYKDKQVNCESEIGQMYMFLGNQDSAFISFHKGLELAESIEHQELQSLLCQNLSVAYAEIKRYEEASSFLHKSMEFSVKDGELPRYYLNFSKLYQKTGKSDSLSFYADKLIQSVDSSSDLYFKISAYYFLAEYAKDNKKYTSAFDYQSKMNNLTIKLNEDRFQQSIFDVKQKYDYTQQQLKYDHNLLQRQRHSIVLLAFLLILALLTVWLLKRMVQQKNSFLSLQNTIQTLYKTAKDLENKMSRESGQEKQLREVLLWKFNILHKSSLLKSELGQLKEIGAKKAIAKYDKIVYGENEESQWNSLVDAIDELNPGLSKFIYKSFPQFNETEFKVCILSYAGLPPKEIAIIINQSVHSVNMGRTRIRQKMELQQHGADFCDFIRGQYNKYRFVD